MPPGLRTRGDELHAVRDAANEKLRIPHGKSVVLPQGLLTPDFGKNITREQGYSRIRKELGLPENSFIVLGCGTLDLRKGIDHFAVVARRVRQEPPTRLREELAQVERRADSRAP